MEVQPIPEDGGKSNDEADRLVAPVNMEEEIPVGCEVEFAGLTTNVEWNGVRGRCLGRALTEGRWLIKTVDGHPLNVRPENVRRLDMPVAEVPQPAAPRQVPTAVALRSPDDAPSRAVIESHNLAHIPYAGWCEICVSAKGRSDHHVLAEPKPIPLVQMDYQYMSATGEMCNFQVAKATVLTVVDADQGEVAANQVAKKGEDQFAIRFVSSFLDRMYCEEVRLRYDNEPSMVQLAEKVKAFRMPRLTRLEPIVRAEHQMAGAVERAHHTIQANVRAMMMDYKARTGQAVIPGHSLFPWMLRQTAWCTSRFQPRGPRAVTAYEARNGMPYKSPIVPFGEAVMVRVPIDPPGLRKKLDGQWVKGVWVGRMDENDGNIVLTPEGTVCGKSVRRLSQELRFQPNIIKMIRSKVSDPVLSQAQLLRILPMSVPIRLEGETEESIPVNEEQVSVEPAVDEMAHENVQIVPADSMEIDNGAE